MKRFLLSLTFCLFLLVSGAFILSTSSAAKDDVIAQLLQMPAPPPPNPLVPARIKRDENFFSKRRVPPDDAPIRELMDYWRTQSTQYQELGYTPQPSKRVIDRLKAEIAKDPRSVAGFLNIFRDSSDGADFVKRIYDNWPASTNDEEYDPKDRLREWLKMNSPHFTGRLEKTALKASERGEYVTNHNDLLKLAKYDWDAARPRVDELYRDLSKPTARVLGTWALYVHALEENSLGDIDRYRDELKAVVEAKTATAGMRDLAFDALVKEKEWSGRDDWYFSLLSDESLAELRVNGTVYTGLTTIIRYSHPDKYADKMIELVGSTDPVVRGAAARNLAVILDAERPDVVKALLPWLEDPKWAADNNGSRMKLLRILQAVKVPESVPVLIKVLDEKETYYVNSESNANFATNTIANAANTAAFAANSAANAMPIPPYRYPYAMNGANAGIPKGRPLTHYPLRNDAINALSKQEDMRAVPALRRILRESEGYLRAAIVKAIYRSKGYTVAEQVNGLETFARTARESMEQTIYSGNAMSNAANTMSNAAGRGVADFPVYPGVSGRGRQPAEELEYMLGSELLQTREPGDQLIREVIARIALLEKREPDVAQTLRGFLLVWKGAAVNAVLLKDLGDGKSDAQAVVKLLSLRKELQERHAGEVNDARKGGPVAAAVAACLMGSDDVYAAILNGQDLEAKTALFACARLIRARLPVKEVAKYVSHSDKRLGYAAESYLESEDSPEARSVVLSLHPNEARIMGATTAFWPEASRPAFSIGLFELFQSVSGDEGQMTETPGAAAFAVASLSKPESAEIEKRLRAEIKDDPDLFGVYSFADNEIRIQKDKVAYSWGTDESRYNERALSKEEFEGFTRYLSEHNVDELVPFLDCERYYCAQEQLLMLGKSGGRRVFVAASNMPAFFEGLSKEFKMLRQGPSRLRYRLEKEVPGLEILLANDDLEAKTVWTNNSEIRVLVADAEKRKQINSEIENAVEDLQQEAEESDEPEDYYQTESKQYEIQQKRRYENYDWFIVDAGRLSARTAQPAEVEFIPVRDSFPVTADEERWKSRSGSVEIRFDGEGLHKIAAGKLTKLKEGEYSSPVLTAAGKWLFASKYTDEGMDLFRINLATNREFPVRSAKHRAVRAIVYVASINRILASSNMNEEYRDYGGKGSYFWVDPDTGAVQPALGEFRPLEDQTFRALQPGPAAFEFWAAIYDPAKKETVVGIYSTRTFALKPVLTVPKVNFDSMDMWVSQTAGKVYFVYNGHLLSLPLSAKS